MSTLGWCVVNLVCTFFSWLLSMEFLPLSLNLQKTPCLLVGGGTVALRKARLLVSSGANVKLVALELTSSTQAFCEQNGVDVEYAAFDEQHLIGQRLVVAATSQREVNAKIAKLAQERGMLVNVVDAPDLGNFIFPAIIDRSPVQIAVSSGGQAPILSRLIRTRLESLVPARYGELSELIHTFRARVNMIFTDLNQRRQFWEKILSSNIAEQVLSGQREAAKQHLAELVQHEELRCSSSGVETGQALMGEVYLVGAGPGDPDLLTFRALRLMHQADVVLYDRLVSPEILSMVRRDADMIHVGKKRAEHAMPQNEINDYLVTLAKEGRRVLRLKGGDPFIFGRGGEEIETLAEHGVPFQVVPGITAAAGCASYAGIPLTHRDHSQSVRFVTGHLKDNTCNLPWQDLVQKNQTLVFYMGLVGLPIICRELIAHGMPSDTPIAIVQKGTTLEQRVVTGQLCNMSERVANEGIKPPTLLIVGSVVSLHEKLHWFHPESPDKK